MGEEMYFKTAVPRKLHLAKIARDGLFTDVNGKVVSEIFL